MQITPIADVLAWSDNPRDELIANYHATLADGLGRVLGRLQAKHPALGFPLAELLKSLPDSAFERLLMAPETSHRLLWPTRHALDEVAAFLRNGALTELARLGRLPHAVDTATWTALGDFCQRPDGSSYAAPVIRGLMVLDFQSPNARDLSRAASAASEYGEESRYDYNVRVQLEQRLTAIMEGIETASRNAAQFVTRFTNIVMFVKAGGPQGEHFLSRSPERHIGLTVLVNAHCPDVDDVELGEALVHEAIHSFVDTYETLANFEDDPAGKWIRDAMLYDGTPRVISPWTGTRLVVPTYVHACFVWYGIVQFWSQALDTRAFPISRVLDRLRAAVRGFLFDDMLDQLVPYQRSFHPQLMTTLGTMRNDVVSAFNATFPAFLAS